MTYEGARACRRMPKDGGRESGHMKHSVPRQLVAPQGSGLRGRGNWKPKMGQRCGALGAARYEGPMLLRAAIRLREYRMSISVAGIGFSISLPRKVFSCKLANGAVDERSMQGWALFFELSSPDGTLPLRIHLPRIPSGREFVSLPHDVYDVSNAVTKLEYHIRHRVHS